MSGFLLALALLFTFGAGACAGWKVCVYAVCRSVANGSMRAVVEQYESKLAGKE